MPLKLDKNTVNLFKEKWSKNILVYFYDAWCSGTKIDLTDDFEITDDLIILKNENQINIYVKKSEKDYLENWIIAKVTKKDHTWKEKIRYILKSEKIKDRCSCWSSFSFSKKKPKINIEKLKNLKNNFR